MIPTHVAIIPDGNRRWAKEHNLPVSMGHKIAAEKTLVNLIKKLAELGVKYFTFWALSTENISKRSESERNALFKLMSDFLTKRIDEFKKNGVKLHIIGDITKLPLQIQKEIQQAVDKTKTNSKITLILGVNYGGRDEIIRAIKKIQSSKFKVQNLTKEDFKTFLDTAGIPDPELIIRTGGEKRQSGFFLWQSEYSELYFSNLYFPDFSPKELEHAINDYLTRQRRFGR